MKIIISIILWISLFPSVHAIVDYRLQDHQTVGDVSWLIAPKIDLPDTLIDKYYAKNDMILAAQFFANTDGIIEHVIMLKASGDTEIDEMVKSSFLRAKIIPYQVDGVYIPVVAVQPVIIKFPKCALGLRVMKRCIF